MPRTHPITIVVHGGAWAIPEALWARSQEGVARAASFGHQCLLGGGSAVDAVVAAVRVLEDDSVFDAGTGSVLNEDGQVEMDAVVMDGKTLRAGAVGAVQNVRNPVSLARLVMDKTDHILLVGAGANKFAALQGVPQVLPDQLVTVEAREQFDSIKDYDFGVDWLFRQQQVHDTVGAVALDKFGHVAAATSTGGITYKMAGRIGDSPLLGAGAFADDSIGAASTTGHGESIMKTLLAFRVLQTSARLSHSETADALHPLEGANKSQNRTNAQIVRACHDELRDMYRRVGGSGGVIGIAPDGTPSIFNTTEHMPWAVAGGLGGSSELRSGMGQHDAPEYLAYKK